MLAFAISSLQEKIIINYKMEKVNDIYFSFRCRGPSLTKSDVLDMKIARFKQEISRVQPPALYFENPDQLQEIFQELEKNNLLALLHCDNLEPPTKEMMAGKRCHKFLIVLEI